MTMVVSIKLLQRIGLFCAIGTVMLVTSFLVGPVTGFYSSRGATYLDGESKGYIRLLDGYVYGVNIRKSAADCERLGHYTVSFPGCITLFDEINNRAYRGRITLWGIWWSNEKDLGDRFMYRAFVGNSYLHAAALPGSLFGKPLVGTWSRSLDRFTIDIVQPKGAPMISGAMARYALEHSELIDPSLPEVRHNTLPLFATIRFLYGDKQVEKRRYEIYSLGSAALGFYYEGTHTSIPAAVFRCRLTNN